jgi:hypothetical protein
MKPKWIAKSILCCSLMAGSSAFADPQISVGIEIGSGGYWYYPPPPPSGVAFIPGPEVVYVPAYPGPGYGWVEGYWQRVGPRYQWRAGYWSRRGGSRWQRPSNWYVGGPREYRNFRERQRDYRYRDRDRDWNRR